MKREMKNIYLASNFTKSKERRSQDLRRAPYPTLFCSKNGEWAFGVQYRDLLYTSGEREKMKKMGLILI
jgi:hypothetical protein